MEYTPNMETSANKAAGRGHFARKRAGEGGLHFPKMDKASISMNVRFRARILVLLVLVILISFLSILSISIRWSNEMLQSDVETYNLTLTEWIGEQKGILDMFCSVISTNPDLLKDYEQTITFLDRITRQYPDISATYMANPAWSPCVYMNSGWLPPEGWLVEEQPWYMDTMASESGWSISAPYYDQQTGLYCITFAERVYDSETGKYLGTFGIDFFMDKLVNILGSSYTDREYAFLADSSGVIINHPNRSYQMTENNAVNLFELNYKRGKADSSRPILIRDYDGTLRILVAIKNEPSNFVIYEAVSFLNVYAAIIISETLILGLLIVCAVMIFRVLGSLIKWQDGMNARMKEAADSAIAGGQAKSRFLAQMSHEIRTPINAVLGMNEMILRESTDPQILDYASDIRVAGRTLLSLINGILDFSKIEEGKMKIIPVEYETASWINNLVASVSERAKAKGLKLTVTVDEKLPSRLLGDDVRLSQVIMNILTNAVKYTEEGEVWFSITEGQRVDDRIKLQVSVKDTGIGIRKEDLPRLFESFERFDEARNHNIEGTGLGMPIVTRLLEMMDTTLNVESVYGEGSTFSFAVWQQVVSDVPIGNYNGRLEGSACTGGEESLSARGARILVVDDNEMNLKVASKLLKLFDIVPDLASSGSEAVECVRKKDYHIIFLDHMMPGMDGIETLAALRREKLLGEGTVVTALTANAVNGARARYLSEGFKDYLSKPLDVRKLKEHLVRYLPAEICQRGDQRAEDGHPELQTALPEDRLLGQLALMGYDTEAGLRYAAGDKAFYLELLKDFAANAGQNARVIRRFYEENEIHAYQIQVHALKSSARQIGANSLSDLALIQETAAKEENREALRTEGEALLKSLKETELELKRLFGEEIKDREEESSPIDTYYHKEDVLTLLEEAAALSDDCEAEAAAVMLRPLADCNALGKGMNAFISEILEALDNFETYRAAELIRRLIGELSDREDLGDG